MGGRGELVKEHPALIGSQGNQLGTAHQRFGLLKYISITYDKLGPALVSIGAWQGQAAQIHVRPSLGDFAVGDAPEHPCRELQTAGPWGKNRTERLDAFRATLREQRHGRPRR